MKNRTRIILKDTGILILTGLSIMLIVHLLG